MKDFLAAEEKLTGYSFRMKGRQSPSLKQCLHQGKDVPRDDCGPSVFRFYPGESPSPDFTLPGGKAGSAHTVYGQYGGEKLSTAATALVR